MGVSWEMERIQADGQIATYLCGAEDSAPSSTWYDGSLWPWCINTNMLLNLDCKAEESRQAKVPYFRGAVRSTRVVGGSQ